MARKNPAQPHNVATLPAAGRRPLPPDGLVVPALGDADVRFVAAPDLAAWIRHTFIDGDGALGNAEHAHLQHASIGVLWTNASAAKQGRWIIGTAEMPRPPGNLWPQQRSACFVRELLGSTPHFVLTFHAPTAVEMSDLEWCALVEHELYHCAQARDEFGAPKFKVDGSPAFTIRGHDVEEFVGVVARYGASSSPSVLAMVEAAKRLPMVGDAAIGRACGTCGRKVA